MNYFTTREQFLFPSFTLDVKEQEKLDRFLMLLDKSGVSELFPKKELYEEMKGGRPHYRYQNIFATILYGFAFTSGTLRDIEDDCKYDLRYIYLMEQETPGHRFLDSPFFLPDQPMLSVTIDYVFPVVIILLKEKSLWEDLTIF